MYYTVRCRIQLAQTILHGLAGLWPRSMHSSTFQCLHPHTLRPRVPYLMIPRCCDQLQGDDSNFSHTRAVRGFDKQELKALSECLKVVIDDVTSYLGPSGDACCHDGNLGCWQQVGCFTAANYWGCTGAVAADKQLARSTSSDAAMHRRDASQPATDHALHDALPTALDARWSAAGCSTLPPSAKQALSGQDGASAAVSQQHQARLCLQQVHHMMPDRPITS